MQPSSLVLLPPLIVIVLATTTRRILLSLFAGIIIAALIVQNFNIVSSVVFIGSRLWNVSELYKLASWKLFWTSSNLFICIFLVILGVLSEMIRFSGAAHAYGSFVLKKLKTVRSIEVATILLSLVFFIDDYFNCLTVSSVMKPITDKFKIPRLKLAFLINSIAAPLAILAPLSSWVANIVAQLKNSGVSATGAKLIAVDPYYLYITSIPFMLYAVLIVATLGYIVFTRVSYGILKYHEDRAQQSGDLFGGKRPKKADKTVLTSLNGHNSDITDFIAPLFLLFVSVIGWLFYTGEWQYLGGSRTLLEAVQQANIYAAFFVGGMWTTFLSFIYFLIRKRLLFTDINAIVYEGFWSIASSIITLLCIWTLSEIFVKDLGTGQYLASFVAGRVDIAMFPCIFFMVSVVIASLMGTAWGTIGMLIPLALPMFVSVAGLPAPVLVESIPLLPALIGAIISGSIVGNHVSPIADVMLISSSSVGADHMDLVKSQMSLAVPTVISSSLGFLLLGLIYQSQGLMLSLLISLVVSVVLNFIFIQSLQWVDSTRR